MNDDNEGGCFMVFVYLIVLMIAALFFIKSCTTAKAAEPVLRMGIQCVAGFDDQALMELPELTDLGTFEITAYCGCEECCGKSDGITYSGTQATAGRTIAVDPDVIPIGTEVMIDGHVYVAEDIGSAIRGSKVDIYFSSHEEALEYGKREEEVYVYEE